MNTNQKYAPQGEQTSPLEPTAGLNQSTVVSVAQAPFTPDERLARIFASQGASDYLEQLLSLIQQYKDSAHPIDAINAIFQRWAKGEDMSADEVTNSFGRILNLLQFLNELASFHDCLLIESDNEQQF